MKFGVVTFPGSNCDDDMVYVLGTQLKQEVVILFAKIQKKLTGEQVVHA